MACTGERRGAYRVCVRRVLEKETTWKSRHKWEDNIKLDLQEMRWGGMNWIIPAQYRHRWRVLVNAVMNLRVP